MAVESVVIDRWRLRIDLEATRAAYRAMTLPGPESCGCLPCQNFVAARDRAYPAPARQLFERLGIDWHKEAEVCHITRLGPGVHLYNGWFHFVGAIDAGREAWRFLHAKVAAPDFIALTGAFMVGLTSRQHLSHPPFRGQQLVQLEFTAEVPWVIDGPEPENVA